jgi:pimeloyl-ACP methyl ester carboxylesterase
VLAAAGYFAVAPNQRGYAAGARPDPTDFDNYRIDKLIGDGNDIVTGVGHSGRRFHLVGHDWGGSLAWIIADCWPERIASLTMLSRPHPASFARALKIDLEQPHRSRHHQELLDPAAGQRLLAENGKWVRDRLARNGVPREAIEKHLSVIGNPPAMQQGLGTRVGPIGARSPRARYQASAASMDQPAGRDDPRPSWPYAKRT